MNVTEALRRGRLQLKSAGIEGYALDALVLLSAAAHKPKEWLFAHGDYVLSGAESIDLNSFIAKRTGGFPVQYILNSCEFMGLDFYVDENVLIPRGDTEILAETVIEETKRRAAPQVLDMCTGSGCVAVSAAYYNRGCNVLGVDISPEAVGIAVRNAESAGVSERTQFLIGDLFEIFEKPVQNRWVFDIIDANPPYIPEAEIPTLSDEVKSEPLIALCGGETGLEFYEAIAPQARKYLKKDGVLILEVGCLQAGRVCEILNNNGYRNISIYKDLSGLDRVVKGEY